MIVQLTPNLPVDHIEPTVAFFARVGFKLALRIPDKGLIDFAIVGNGNQQVMIQSRKGLVKDNEAFHKAAQTSPVMLYVTVDDVEAIAATLNGFDIAMDWRETSYGAREICFKEPGGHLVTFAQFPEMFLPD